MQREETPLLGVRDEDAVERGDDSLRDADEDADTLQTPQAEFLTKLLSRDSSSRDRALYKDGVGPAAFLIRDAVLGHNLENPAEGSYDPYSVHTADYKLRNAVALFCQRVCSYRYFIRLFHVVCWFLLSLTFFEVPAWCKSGDDELMSSDVSDCNVLLTARGIPAGGSGTDKEVEYYPNAHSFLITAEQSDYIEMACVVLIGLALFLRIGRDGMSLAVYLRKGTARINRAVQLVCWISIIFGLITGISIHHPYARLGIAMSLNEAGYQRDMGTLFRILPNIVRILLLLGLIILFYAWFGAVMFLGTEEGEAAFPSLIEGMWTLWICVTTANFPDVAMPAYNENRWVALYFVSFMGISFFFLMNLMLAVIVQEYESVVAGDKEQREELVDEYLAKAYKLLDPAGVGAIDCETVMALFCILNEDFPEFETLSDDEAMLLFAVLDKDGSGDITEEEFMSFGEIMLVEFDRESDYSTWVERCFPKFSISQKYQKFCSFVKSARFEKSIDSILLLNAVIVGIQSYPELSNNKVQVDPAYFDGSLDTPWEFVEALFTAIYSVEIIVKVSVYGWKVYIENLRNVFDFTVTVLAVICSCIVYYPNDFSDSRLIRMIVMARVLRLIRVLTTVKTFKLLLKVSAEILPAATSVVLVLFFLLYFFATLGVHLYGGMVTRDPANPLAYLILDTDFSDNNYWANNFNDMFSAINVLFNLLVINNWTQCEIGFEAVTQQKWVRLFFVSFHIFGVVMTNNLVIAFIISAFLEQLPIVRRRAAEDEVLEDGGAVLRGRRAVFDASEVTGTKTNLKGGYVARIRSGKGDNRQRLRALFTRKRDDGKREPAKG